MLQEQRTGVAGGRFEPNASTIYGFIIYSDALSKYRRIPPQLYVDSRGKYLRD